MIFSTPMWLVARLAVGCAGVIAGLLALVGGVCTAGGDNSGAGDHFCGSGTVEGFFAFTVIAALVALAAFSFALKPNRTAALVNAVLVGLFLLYWSVVYAILPWSHTEWRWWEALLSWLFALVLVAGGLLALRWVSREFLRERARTRHTP